MNRAVSASSQQYCEGKYIQDFRFPASSINEISMTRLDIQAKHQVLYDFTFHIMPYQDEGNIC